VYPIGEGFVVRHVTIVAGGRTLGGSSQRLP
jgi:hypothetical protein